MVFRTLFETLKVIFLRHFNLIECISVTKNLSISRERISQSERRQTFIGSSVSDKINMKTGFGQHNQRSFLYYQSIKNPLCLRRDRNFGVRCLHQQRGLGSSSEKCLHF